MSTGATLSLLSELNRLEALREPQRQGLRQFRRFPIRGDAELHPAEGSQVDRTPVDVKLRDIGRGGVGFVCERPLPLDSVWHCCFLTHGHAIARQALTVRHCRLVQPGVYLVGCQFCVDSGILIAVGVPPHELPGCDVGERCGSDDQFDSPGDL